jgi:hypothetical protein
VELLALGIGVEVLMLRKKLLHSMINQLIGVTNE